MSITARAHQILDRARSGEPVSSALIAWALRRTGDIPSLRWTEGAAP